MTSASQWLNRLTSTHQCLFPYIVIKAESTAYASAEVKKAEAKDIGAKPNTKAKEVAPSATTTKSQVPQVWGGGRSFADVLAM
jgi:cell wall-associated NlpC family hydrolase